MYFMINGLLKGSLLVIIISLYWKKRFSREHTKNLIATVRARPGATFWAMWYHPPPPESQKAFPIYYVKYEKAVIPINIIILNTDDSL